MLLAGASRIAVVISPGKSDILEYYGATYGEARIAYVVQAKPAGLCDAIFQALPLIPDGERAIVGLPDTVWFPADGLNSLGDAPLEFLLFPVDRPELFDAVVTDAAGDVREVQVKRRDAASRWIWGAFCAHASALRELESLWRQRNREDVYFGTLVNAWLARGGRARAARAGRAYVDVGTLHGYREAIRLLGETRPEGG
jgi:dTDP-glucose pyrophosphorylase